MYLKISKYDKNKVQIAKAMIPFLIILHHCYFLAGLNPFHSLGIILVSFFFLMSGYGLMTSYMSKGEEYLNGFFLKRVMKVFLPYLLSLCVWFGYMIFADKNFNILRYLLYTNFGDWLPNSWFVWVILGAYICFFCIFKFHINLKTKILVFASVSLIYFILGGAIRYIAILVSKFICYSVGYVMEIL